MKKAITLILIFALSHCAISQSYLDSLWNTWNDKNLTDSKRLYALYDLISDGYLHSQPDSAFYYSQMYYEYAKQKGLKKEMSKSLYIQGYSLAIIGEYEEAIGYYNKGLKIMEGIGYSAGVAAVLNGMGIVRQEQGDYASGIDYYHRSLRIKEEIGNKKGIATTLNNIGTVYEEQGDYNKALEYNVRSLHIRQEIDSKRGISSSLHNIGVVYQKQGDYSMAIDYLNRGLAIHEEIGDISGAGNGLISIGETYYLMGDHKKALDHYYRGATFLEEVGEKRELAHALNGVGVIYQEQGNYAIAIANSSRALVLAREVGTAIETRDAAKTLYELYKHTGRSSEALEMLELFVTKNEDIIGEESQREVIRRGYQYEYDKKALADSINFANQQIFQEARIQNTRMQFQGALVIILLVTVMATIFFIGREKQKKLNNELKQTQSQLVQSEKIAAIGQLTAGVAHEMNNPLNFAQNSSIALEKDLKDLLELNDRYQEALYENKISVDDVKAFEREIDATLLRSTLLQEAADIREGTSRTSEIVKGLRAFSRDDSQDKIMANIHDGLESTLDLIKSRLNHIKVMKSYDESIGSILCYPGRLNQVFLNILLNALTAIGDKGSITITTNLINGMISISFIDDGPGIKKEIQSKIFDPFFTTKDVGEGTGLGLSISYGIIKDHGGEIKVESPSVGQVSKNGKGSEFVITLPVT